MTKTEMKQLWTHSNEYQLNTLNQGYVTSGPLINQGDDGGNRKGNMVTIHGLHLRGALSTNASVDCFVRMVVVGYPATNGDPTLNLYRNGQGGNSAGVANINGLDAIYWPLNKLQLHVYHDQVFKIASNVAGNAGANLRTFNKFIKFGGKKVEYKGSYSGQGNQNWLYSTIWIAAEGPDDTSSGNTIELSLLERLYFKDM